MLSDKACLAGKKNDREREKDNWKQGREKILAENKECKRTYLFINIIYTGL